MKQDIPLRIAVIRPPRGVAIQIQKGRDELTPPKVKTDNQIVFDFPVSVDLSSGSPNFLGKFAQGPKTARFVYVNSGTMAGQPDSCWTRRAKISLMSISQAMIEDVLANGDLCLEARFYGMARDGGPACASVKLLGEGWTVTLK